MTDWTDLGDGVRVRQSRAYAMNSTLLLHPGHAVLVDPGVLPSELDALAAAVRDVAPREVALVFTHSHWDHVLGQPWWPWAMLIGHPGLGPAMQAGRAAILADAERCAREYGEIWTRGFAPHGPEIAVSGDGGLVLGPWSLVLREAPGHCDDQLAVHLPARGLLLAGDLLSDLEIPWLDREPAVFRRTLGGLRALAAAGDVETLVPGHGRIARGRAAVLERIERDLGYLDALEQGVEEARRAGLDLAAAQARLGALDYVGKGAATPMDDVHRGNVRIAWERAAGPPA